MRVLIACEESQAVVKEFRRLGHEAYSCDIEECSGGHPEIHLRVDALELLKMRWDMIIAHPPCTFLTVTGNRWFNVDKYGDDARKRERERERGCLFHGVCGRRLSSDRGRESRRHYEHSIPETGSNHSTVSIRRSLREKDVSLAQRSPEVDSAKRGSSAGESGFQKRSINAEMVCGGVESTERRAREAEKQNVSGHCSRDGGSMGRR